MKKISLLFIISFVCFLQYGFTAEPSPEEYILSQLKITPYPSSKLDISSTALQYVVEGKTAAEIVNYYKTSLTAKGWRCEIKNFDEQFVQNFTQLKKTIGEANKKGLPLPQNMDKKTAEQFASLDDAYIKSQVKIYSPIVIEATSNISNSTCAITVKSLSETITLVNIVLQKTL